MFVSKKLQLALDGPQLKLDLGLDGQLDKGNWRGRLASGEIQAGGQDWRLQAPAKLQRLASGQVGVRRHCWRSGQASLCGEDQRLAPEPRLRYHLKQFPLQSLAQWLPKDFCLAGPAQCRHQPRCAGQRAQGHHPHRCQRRHLARA
nr:hypothetical protein [Pseudomonas sp. BIGb0427]